jgi:hypothetical protein
VTDEESRFRQRKKKNLARTLEQEIPRFRVLSRTNLATSLSS